MNVKDMITKAAMDQALEYISKNPEENLPKALNFLDNIGWIKIDDSDVSGALHKVLDDKENIWYKYIMNLYKDIDIDVLKTIFKNFVVNAVMLGFKKQLAEAEKQSCNIPWAI